MAESDIATLLKTGSNHLATRSETARLDAEVLLAHVLSQPRAYLYTWPERVPCSTVQADYRTLLARRANGEPIAYLTGRRAFWSLELRVTPDTLIPRPESELLVSLALARLQPCRNPRIADLGTGSGALALALARERPDARIVAVDNSPAALAVAIDNARSSGLENVTFRHSDWCEQLASDAFDLIVANPPYIAVDSPWLRTGDIRFEPPTALIAGPDGLAAIRRIVAQSPRVLKPGAWLLIEHGFDQGGGVVELLRHQGFTDVVCHRDPGDRDRVGGGRRPG